MAAELVWREQALADLLAVMEYIAYDNPKAARNHVDALEQTCERLRDFPQTGRHYHADYRILVFRNHLAIYKFDPSANVVLITRVLDGRRDVARILDAGDELLEQTKDQRPT